MKFADGTLIANRYKILAFHLEGGMQEVYKCRDEALQRVVALKTPKEGIVDKRFHRGAQMGARVNHPNVAATLDYVDDGAVRCVVEEFIVGEDLGRRLTAEFTFLDPDLAARLVHQLAKGLQAAHAVGICHRDLKPSNVMTSKDPHFEAIKLTDFGIAKLAQSEIEVEMEAFEKDQNTLTSSSTLLGAAPYMAPECWSDWSTAGQPADIWSLGSIACHALLGKPPFGTGQKAIMKMAQMMQSGKVELDPPTWLGKHPNTAPLEQGLWSIVMKCLQVDPKLRPTADDVIGACDQLCYTFGKRRTGTITTYPLKYKNGGVSESGFITINGTFDQSFFHSSDFFGDGIPKVGQRVSFTMFPGDPNPRSAPVLLLR
jgi:serine/threonine protein kinase